MKCSTRFSFLRKPFKLILVVLLTVLISTAALVFSLQAYLDGIVMDHAMNSTAYVGTVYSRMHKYPMIKELPDSIFSMLESSPSVDAVMISPTYSGKAEGLNRVADVGAHDGPHALCVSLQHDGRCNDAAGRRLCVRVE